jgi:VanZ family protein
MILLGALLELAQLFVFGRSGDIKDEAANTLGSLGGTAWGVILRFRGKTGLLAGLL